MAQILSHHHLLHPPPLFLSPPPPPSSSSSSLSKCRRFRSSSRHCFRPPPSVAAMKSGEREGPKFKEFPYASPPIRDLMVELVSTVENRLNWQLLPSSLPKDVEYYQNQNDTAHASLLVRPGAPSSPINFILGSWIHCNLPTGGALNITSLVSYMNSSTDLPQLLIEFIQSGPTSLVLLLDLPPRKDLVLHPDYLKTFYEDSGLENQRQILAEIPEVQPYFSSSLFIRSICSPTATLVRIDTGNEERGGERRMEEILRENVSVAAKEVLGIWLKLCVEGERREIGDEERDYLKKRDSIVKNKSIEIDVGANLPRLFGQEIADRVLGELMRL